MENKTDYVTLGFRVLWVSIAYLAVVSYFSPNSKMLSIEGIPFLIGMIFFYYFMQKGLKI